MPQRQCIRADGMSNLGCRAGDHRRARQGNRRLFHPRCDATAVSEHEDQSKLIAARHATQKQQSNTTGQLLAHVECGRGRDQGSPCRDRKVMCLAKGAPPPAEPIQQLCPYSSGHETNGAPAALISASPRIAVALPHCRAQPEKIHLQSGQAARW